MTFQQWQEQYSGVRVTPCTEADGVFMISDRLLPGGPLADLRELSDYWVTSEMLQAHYGPTVWLAPRDEARVYWTRADYMDHRVSHERYYLGLAHVIGLERLSRLIVRTFGLERLMRACADGLNTIALSHWDGLHGAIRPMISAEVMRWSWSGQPLPERTICWSWSESVCVAKAVARYVVEQAERRSA